MQATKRDPHQQPGTSDTVGETPCGSDGSEFLSRRATGGRVFGASTLRWGWHIGVAAVAKRGQRLEQRVDAFANAYALLRASSLAKSFTAASTSPFLSCSPLTRRP